MEPDTGMTTSCDSVGEGKEMVDCRDWTKGCSPLFLDGAGLILWNALG